MKEWQRKCFLKLTQLKQATARQVADKTKCDVRMVAQLFRNSEFGWTERILVNGSRTNIWRYIGNVQILRAPKRAKRAKWA